MKKYIRLLWLSALILFIAAVVIAQFRPFTQKQSSILIFIIFSICLTAMLLQTLKNRNIDRTSSNKNLDEETRRRLNLSSFISKITVIIVGYIMTIIKLLSELY
jgi:uncharacterized membrane protein YidH (DUF202 family)